MTCKPPEDYVLLYRQGQDFDDDDRTHVRIKHEPKGIVTGNSNYYYQYKELSSVVYAYKYS